MWEEKVYEYWASSSLKPSVEILC